jgi:trehalose 6-phosphate synthase
VARRRLIVVSNRGPVRFSRDAAGERTAERGAGGLVTALRGLLAHHDVTWIASAVSDEDNVVAAEGTIRERARDGSPYRLRLVRHEAAAYHLFYNVVANPMLWFIAHQLWGLGSAPALTAGFHRAWDEGYAPVNARFAEAVLAELEEQPDATVFFHDYHLYLAPRLVRDAAPEALLAHFLHIPWPQSDAWRVLPEPRRQAVHDGLLANDVVGFHTARWRDNFAGSCADVLGVESRAGLLEYAGRRVLAVAHPISIDVGEFEELAESEAVLEAERALCEDRAERLVLRVDRTDPSKNVVRGFQAFEAYLEAHPEARGRVVMLALLDPSRQDIPEYVEYLAAVERTVAEVNDRFADGDWMPIRLEVEDDFPRSVAAYKQFDVLLTNAVYDGLNLVAKEAMLVNRRDGALVLSENVGAHEELGEWALTVNPFDVAGQAEALHAALELPHEERRRRIEAIRAHVREHDVGAWLEAQLADVDRIAARVPSRS